MSTDVEMCPVCKTNNLKLHQIDRNKAVYLCTDSDCTYPNGYKWRIINRKWTNITKKVKKLEINGDNESPSADMVPPVETAKNDDDSFFDFLNISTSEMTSKPEPEQGVANLQLSDELINDDILKQFFDDNSFLNNINIINDNLGVLDECFL